MRILSLLLTLVALSAVQSTPLTLSLKHQKKVAKSSPTLGHDFRSRLDLLKYKPSPGKLRIGQSSAQSFTAYDAYNQYVVQIGLGSPVTSSNQKYLEMIIDTGSSVTWFGSNDTSSYVRKSSSKDQHKDFTVVYGIGYAMGKIYKDDLYVLDSKSNPTSLVATRQIIGYSTQSQSFSGVDGILGLGPKALTLNTVNGLNTFDTFPATLANQGSIPANIVSLFFVPATTVLAGEANMPNGAITFGGTDSKDYVGSIKYHKKLGTYPHPGTGGYTAKDFWGLSVAKFSFQTLESNGKAKSYTLRSKKAYGFVDSGTTLIGLPTDAFDAYIKLLPGTFVDSATGITLIPKKNIGLIGNFTIEIDSRKYVLVPSAQVFPDEVAKAFYVDTSKYYASVFANSFSDGTIDFVLGMLFLERYYACFDTKNWRIGFADTKYTYAKTTLKTAFKRTLPARLNATDFEEALEDQPSDSTEAHKRGFDIRWGLSTGHDPSSA